MDRSHSHSRPPDDDRPVRSRPRGSDDSVRSCHLTRREWLGIAAGAALPPVATGCLERSADPTDKVESLPTPAIGRDDAPVTVRTFQDYACPHCRTFTLEVLPVLREEYVRPGRARVEHYDFPIPVDPTWSWQAPSAARAVQDRQGTTAFFEYCDRLYAHQDRLSPEVVADLARTVGADGSAVRKAAVTERYRPVIERDREHGKDAGVEATPTVFVGDERLPDYSYATISAAIEARLGDTG